MNPNLHSSVRAPLLQHSYVLPLCLTPHRSLVLSLVAIFSYCFFFFIFFVFFILLLVLLLLVLVLLVLVLLIVLLLLHHHHHHFHMFFPSLLSDLFQMSISILPPPHPSRISFLPLLLLFLFPSSGAVKLEVYNYA